MNSTVQNPTCRKPTIQELEIRQRALEYESRDLAAARYNRETDRRIQRNEEHNNTYGKLIIKHSIDKLTEALEAWFDQCEQSGAAQNAVAFPLLKGTIGGGQVSLIGLQVVIGSISTQPKMLPTALEIATRIEDEIRLGFLRKKDAKAFKRLLKSCNNKLQYSFKHDSVTKVTTQLSPIDVEPWTRVQKTHVGTLIINLILNHLGLVEKEKSYDGKKTTETLIPTQATVELIEKNRSIAQYMRPFLDPTILPPKPWKPGMTEGGGYFSHAQRPIKLVKTHYKEQLEAVSKADMPKVLNALNAAQNTAWKVNGNILNVAKQIAQGASGLGGLPRGVDIPLPPKPLDKDTNEAALIEWKIKVRQIYIANNKAKAQRIGLHMLIDQAERFLEYDAIYFPHQLDTRGRVYSVTNGGISPQGSDLSKALIHFSEAKPIGEDGITWFKVHLANLFGVDKVSFKERVQWVDEHQEELFASALDPYANTFWADADKPFQALACCFEYAQILYHGPNHMTRIPVALDGSCSGLQNLAMALRCEKTGSSVNLIPSDTPSDIYSDVATMVAEYLTNSLAINTGNLKSQARRQAIEHVATVLGKEKKRSKNSLISIVEQAIETKDTTNALAKEAYDLYNEQMMAWAWLKFGINRKLCKRPVMTFAYGSGVYGFTQQLKDDILYPAYEETQLLLQQAEITAQEAEERFPFEGRGDQAASMLAKHIYKAVIAKVDKAATIMKWMQECAKLIAKDKKPIWWTTPLGLPVLQKYMKQETHRVQTCLGGQIWRPRVQEDTDEIDSRRMANAISPNLVHSLDSSHLMLVVDQALEEGIDSFALIHDSFGTHASDIPRFFQIVREAFVELYKVNPFIELAESFRGQMSEKVQDSMPSLPPEGLLDISSVLQSDFAFA